MLSKGIFVVNNLMKSKLFFIHVFKMGTRCFNKNSVKLLNRCVGLSGPPDFGLPFKSLDQWIIFRIFSVY